MSKSNTAERTTITLPSALYQRLQAVKDRLNVSAICQEAIEHAISMEEIRVSTLEKKQKVIERLRLERQNRADDWFDCGKTDGLKDAEDLLFEDFEALYDIYQNKSELEHYDRWLELDELPEDLQESLQETMEKYSPKPIEKNYLAGWIDGVIDFWEEIKDEI